MKQPLPKENFDKVLKVVGENLKPLGFARKGHVFRLLRNGNCGLIEFQRSDKNTDEKLLFTINLGVVCGELLGWLRSGIAETRLVDAHLRLRIGKLLPDRPDKWWEVTGLTDLVLITKEVVELLLKRAVPLIESHLETKALLDLWESGQSPGLTEFQRKRFLSELKKKSGNASEE